MSPTARIGAITWRGFRLELHVDEACDPAEMYVYDVGEDRENVHIGVSKEPNGMWGAVLVVRGVEGEGEGPTWREALNAAFEDLVEEHGKFAEAISSFGPDL